MVKRQVLVIEVLGMALMGVALLMYGYIVWAKFPLLVVEGEISLTAFQLIFFFVLLVAGGETMYNFASVVYGKYVSSFGPFGPTRADDIRWLPLITGYYRLCCGASCGLVVCTLVVVYGLISSSQLFIGVGYGGALLGVLLLLVKRRRLQSL